MSFMFKETTTKNFLRPVYQEKIKTLFAVRKVSQRWILKSVHAM